jgi:hypothetical protein
MKTAVDIFNEMWFTYHWASPYSFPYETNDIRFIMLDAVKNFAESGEYH